MLFTDRGQCRPLMDFKGFNWTTATDEDRIEFALADVNEAGMSHNELRAILHGLNKLGKRPLCTVETGLGFGFSTRLFASWVAGFGGEHHVFEVVPENRPIVGMLQELDMLKHIQIHKGDARAAAWPSEPLKIIDFLNIDSEHAFGYVLSEYCRFRMSLSHNTIVGFHDVDSCPGVRRGIEVLREMDRLHLLIDETGHAGAGYQTHLFKGHDRNDNDYWKRFLTDEAFYADNGVDILPGAPSPEDSQEILDFRTDGRAV